MKSICCHNLLTLLPQKLNWNDCSPNNLLKRKQGILWIGCSSEHCLIISARDLTFGKCFRFLHIKNSFHGPFYMEILFCQINDIAFRITLPTLHCLFTKRMLQLAKMLKTNLTVNWKERPIISSNINFPWWNWLNSFL